jgi:hypothetical protein
MKTHGKKLTSCDLRKYNLRRGQYTGPRARGFGRLDIGHEVRKTKKGAQAPNKRGKKPRKKDRWNVDRGSWNVDSGTWIWNGERL